MRTRRVGEIELFRIMAAMLVLLGHTCFTDGCPKPVPGGYIGVEFFFLLSGYLMAAHICKTAGPPSLMHDTYAYLWRRLASFWPELIVSSCIGLCVFALAHDFSVHATCRMAYETLMGNILLLDMTTLSGNGVNGVSWYLSSLLICSAVLYPMLRRFAHSPIWVVLSLLMLGMAQKGDLQTGFVLDVRCFLGVCNVGTLRAFGELLLGASLFPAVQCLAQKSVAPVWRVGCLVLKWVCWTVVLAYAVHPVMRMTPAMIVALCCILVICFSGLSPELSWCGKPWVMWLGRFSLPLYLSHIFWAKNLALLLPPSVVGWPRLCLYVLVSCLTSLLTMFLAKQLRRWASGWLLCSK